MEDRKEAMLKKLAARHEQRLLKSVNQPQKKIDLKATEKAFLNATPSTHTPTRPATIDATDSPILSFDEAAEKQVVALSTWCNTMLGTDQTEEVDLGATKAEALKRIQSMLTKKSTSSEEPQERAPRFHRLFETNDAVKIKHRCQKILQDSGVDESLKELLSKGVLAVRSELAVYSDLTVHTSLLRIFLSFHPVWLKAALEAIFDVSIASRNLVGSLSRFLIERVFSNPRMLKNKKFAQGSGKPIVTAAGKEALHRHFLLITMKLMLLIETAHSQKVIPNLTRIFTKSSTFKSLDEMCSELTKELLSGSSAPLKKAFVKIGFTPSYVQSFFENYDYQAKGFSDFQDGLILAKLVETVGELKHGELLLKLRDPQGDRIRKVNNVKVVLQKMSELGIHTEDVTPSCIVAGKKAEILAILWSLVGVRVAKERKVKVIRSHEEDKENPQKSRRRSAIHDDVSSEVLKTCKEFGRLWDIEVLDLDSLLDGRLLAKVWSTHAPNEAPIEVFEGRGLWEKVVTAAETELHIRRGLDQNVALFAKEFIRRAQLVKMYNERAAVIQKAWRGYAFRKKTPKLYSVVLEAVEHRRRTSTSSPEARLSTVNDATFTIPRTPSVSERDSLCDSTFTVSRDSVSGGSSSFKMPRTPARVTFASQTMQRVIVEEEEEDDEDVTIVPSTEKKRKVFPEGGVKEHKELNVVKSEIVDAPEAPEAPEDVENREMLQKTVLDEPEIQEIHMVAQEAPEDVQSSQMLQSSVLDEPELQEIYVATPEVSEDVESSEMLQKSVIDEPQLLNAPENVQSSQMLQNSILNEPELHKTPEDVQSSQPLQQSMLNEPELHEHTTNAPHDPELTQSSEMLQNSALHEPQLQNAPEDVPMLQNPATEDSSNDSIDNSITQGHLVRRAKQLNVLRRHQQEFVDSHHLDLQLAHDKQENIDDLRRLLRETRELKKKQQKVELQASNLRQLERQALANAHCRSGAGLDEAMLESEQELSNSDAPGAPEEAPENLIFIKTTSKVCVTVTTSSEVVVVPSPESRAAITIQKAVRGFLARRRVREELAEMRRRVQLYRDALLHENDQLASAAQSGSAAEPYSSSIESKLKRAALHGLTSDNLHFVHLGATIIDRITELVPSLLDKFVVELNGISLIYDILRVADRGIPYKTILQPLFSILHKSFRHVSKEHMEEPVVPLLPKLTGRLAEMLLMYCGEKENCLKLAGVLNVIGRRWPSKKSTRLDKAAYFIEKSIKKTSDPECRRELMSLKTVCDLLV